MSESSSIHRSFKRKLRRERERLEDPGEDMSEINLVPYLDIITNILLFLLVTITSMVAIGEIEIVAPEYSPGAVAKKQENDKNPAFNLTVMITNKGFTVTGSTGVLYENDIPGKLPTVPIIDGNRYNFPALQKVIIKVKKKYPKEQQAILSANPDIPYETIVGTMDIVRVGPKDEPLFPTIVFSAGIE